MPVTTKTVLELDLVGYSTIAAALQDGLGVETSLTLNRQIQEFVDVGLVAAGVTRKAAVVQTTGDGAILIFDQPTQAHTFAEAVQQAARAHCDSKPVGIGKRAFRIGIATGELVLERKTKAEGGGFEIGGMTIARAVRLEAKARPGEVLCDATTFAGLTAEQQKQYSGVEVVAGKRNEMFEAHRAALNPNGAKDAEFFTGSLTQPTTEAVSSKPVPAVQGDKSNRKEILALFGELKSHQFDELIFLLDMPFKLRPSGGLNLEARKDAILNWATEEHRLDTLLDELRELVSAPLPIPKAVMEPANRSLQIVKFEFVLDTPLESFSESHFLLALVELGFDISRVRIIEIRSGSTIVQIEGDQTALQRALALLEAGGILCDVFVRKTRLREVRWQVEGQPRVLRFAPFERRKAVPTTPVLPSTARNSTECKVVVFAANPAGTSALALDEEIREITAKIRASHSRDAIRLSSRWAVRPDDLLQTLNEEMPHVVQFSGHGSKAGELVLLDKNGYPKTVSQAALSHLFQTMKGNIRLVVLNACYSRLQAEAIVKHIDCAIGTSDEIGDDGAIVFASSFYRALGFGSSVKDAFEQGKAALLLEGMPEKEFPELLSRQGVNPAQVYLLNPT
ncbi:chat domain protein : Uncharacterized protein OS=Methanosaeta concilii (strain ATCC 5969 / DSM 3671 / JCM 10134 / NBRC 103675 / OCM 69 / GP-6) GN=MCON_1746 PE=4 SV=1: Guanylate_cyc: CHAT [Gemmata massiliana]|uniref:Guanylate cyclase domain-containing protein n=1 Tax=Gemmata massiliana TaxID=1210884 RepID=A0A6P2CX17_9BACT|nr:CHAT domain-containing protein [Gemmata massiliana]VTR91710.1 chat domain protein : Uncharacterized protein OS=Methanosaeta concilii (strain ATCC 5969 / DSM 3671 / JCM 10134 / NBRC 103675 / OCM 69 / GP-6) GN=MCON_1746 PE=4 SV=1: Guanylate_cyc: CHAT [Gemmata massiliana]